MNNTIQYKGYIGSVEFSEDDAQSESDFQSCFRDL